MLALNHSEKCRFFLLRKREREQAEEFQKASDAVHAAEKDFLRKKDEKTAAAEAAASANREVLQKQLDRSQHRLTTVVKRQSAVGHVLNAYSSDEALAQLAVRERPSLEASKSEYERQVRQVQEDITKIDRDLEKQLRKIANQADDEARQFYGPLEPSLAPSELLIEEIE